jgi:hypothetical protein
VSSKADGGSPDRERPAADPEKMNDDVAPSRSAAVVDE